MKVREREIVCVLALGLVEVAEILKNIYEYMCINDLYIEFISGGR